MTTVAYAQSFLHGCLSRLSNQQLKFLLSTEHDKTSMCCKSFREQQIWMHRGCPTTVYSDNGTNFQAGERELRELLNDWNQESIHKFLHQKNIRWKFNPPAASHMSGAWERTIRSVRKILRALLGQQLVSDEMLRTLMSEVEGILNGRPLTPVSSDPKDLDPLTPNRLLLLRANPNLPPGVFSKEEMYQILQ